MRCWLTAVVLGLLAPAAPLAQQGFSSNLAAAPPGSADVYAALSKVALSLVRIHVVSIEHEDGRALKREASGSGTIITPEGHVVTNHHVAGKTKAIVCTLATREEIPAE